MRRFTVEIDNAAFERLAEIARREKRTPRAQAAWILEFALAERDEPAETKPDVAADLGPWIGA